MELETDTKLPEFLIHCFRPLQQLFKAAGYNIVMPEMVNREVWEGAAIRQAMTEGDEWETAVPPQIVNIIHDLNGIEKLQNLTQADPLPPES